MKERPEPELSRSQILHKSFLCLLFIIIIIADCFLQSMS